MADGKKKRTRYSLHRNVPVEIPAGFDQLCDPEGAQIVDANGEPTVDGVVGPSPSTLFSVGGSFCAWAGFLWFAVNIYESYQSDPPTIYEQTLDTPRDYSAPMPDFAVTLALYPRDFYVANQIRQIKAAHGSSKTWKEAEFEAKGQWELLSEDQQNFYKAVDDRTLEYLWPVFRWEKIRDGLEEKRDVHMLLGREDGLRFGDACGLSASWHLKYGRWPVFCFLNSLAKEPRKLHGFDYGDPFWKYLDLRIVRCTNMSAAEVEWEKGHTNVSAPFPWSGTCAPHDDIDELVDSGQGLGVNLWFKLPSDPDWTESRWNRYAGRPAPEDNSMVTGWTIHEYQKLSSTSHVECDLYLKHAEAYVNDPRSFGFSNFMPYLSWFDFDRSECSHSYADDARFKEFPTLFRWDFSGHRMGENRTRFSDVRVRMHNKRRRLLVRRQNAREMVSEISGSWEISFFFGWLVVVVINRALMAASACPRDREEAKAVWTRAYGRGAPKVAAAEAPAPASAAEAAAPAATEASVRSLWSVRSRSSSRSLVPEGPAPPPLDPRKFAELLERVKKLEEQARNS